MIYAKTYMKNMPECCGECDVCVEVDNNRVACQITGLRVDPDKKGRLCRLESIDSEPDKRKENT